MGTKGNPNPKKVRTFAIQIGEDQQIRIRLTEWRGKDKVFIQSFYKPTDGRPVEADGYAFGKAVTILPEQWPSLYEAMTRFNADFTERYRPAKPAPTKPAAESDAVMVGIKTVTAKSKRREAEQKDEVEEGLED